MSSLAILHRYSACAAPSFICASRLSSLLIYFILCTIIAQLLMPSASEIASIYQVPVNIYCNKCNKCRFELHLFTFIIKRYINIYRPNTWDYFLIDRSLRKISNHFTINIVTLYLSLCHFYLFYNYFLSLLLALVALLRSWNLEL